MFNNQFDQFVANELKCGLVKTNDTNALDPFQIDARTYTVNESNTKVPLRQKYVVVEPNKTKMRRILFV